MDLKQDSEKLESYLIEIRRKIHEKPELGFQEFETTKLITRELDNLNISYEKQVAITGIVATLQGGKGSGKTILIRADMDALPLIEETNLPFKSRNEGIFHACGHDTHVACLLGTASLLNERLNDFKGQVKLVFQPAEEKSNVYDKNGSGGAAPMIKERPDLFKHDAALALHIRASTEEYSEVGKIAVKNGPSSGSSDEFFVKVIGKGGHASSPHTAVDPVYIASQIYVAIQGFLTRTVDPLEPVVFTVGKIVGGFRHNIISETCQMECTLRTLNEELRTKLQKELPAFMKKIAQAYGGDVDIQTVIGYPVGSNSEIINNHIIKTATELYGSDSVVIRNQAILGAEDFYDFGFKNKIPIAMFYLGGANKAKGLTNRNHSNKFDIDESALSIGSAILTGTAISYLNDN